MAEHHRTIQKWVHGKQLAVLVLVERVEADDDPWSPYFDPDDVRKLEAARRAADAGDVDEASKYGRVFKLEEVTAQ